MKLVSEVLKFLLALVFGPSCQWCQRRQGHGYVGTDFYKDGRLFCVRCCAAFEGLNRAHIRAISVRLVETPGPYPGTTCATQIAHTVYAHRGSREGARAVWGFIAEHLPASPAIGGIVGHAELCASYARELEAMR